MTAPTTRANERRDALRRALLVLVCVTLAVLPFNGAAGAGGHPCDARILSKGILAQTSGLAHDAMHSVGTDQNAGAHASDRDADHGAAGLPGATCATCALHCSFVFAFGEALPLRREPAPTPVMLAPIAGPPGLNPAPADPPPRA